MTDWKDLPWTPGPWRAAGTNGSHVVTESKVHDDNVGPWEQRVAGYGRSSDFICDLNDGEYHEYKDHAEQSANAELIALAPEMAALILGCTAINGDQYAADADDAFEPMWHKLREIIATRQHVEQETK